MHQLYELLTSGFIVVDVELASHARGSICQAGLAYVEDGVVASSRSWLLRPAGHFDRRMTRVHGLDSQAVRQAPAWPGVYAELRREMHGRVIVSHTYFDRQHIFAACCRSGTVMVSYRRWYDSCALARHAWPGLPSYALAALAARIGFTYKAHDAEQDARAAAMVCLAALRTIRGSDEAVHE